MAAKTFYIKAALAGSSSHGSLQDGGSPPADANSNTGWLVGTTAPTSPGPWRRMVYASGAASGFGAPLQPSGAPVTNDCWRSEQPIYGVFQAGDWEIHPSFRGMTQPVTGSGRLNFRLWRSANEDGSSATEITSGVVETDPLSNILTSADQSVALFLGFPAVTLAGEYLFFQCAWEITGASASGVATVRFRVGSNSYVATPNFLPGGDCTIAATDPVEGCVATAAQALPATIAATDPVEGGSTAAAQVFASAVAATDPVDTSVSASTSFFYAPPERTFRIPFDNRVFRIPFDNRTFRVR